MLLTYRKLAEALSELSEDQLDMSVTIYGSYTDESFGVNSLSLFGFIPGTELDLEPTQPVMVIEGL